jgi:hypothetical protein
MNKDQILYYLLPITWKHEKNAILGHVDVLKKSLDIINKNTFHYLMSKNSKKIFIQINLCAIIPT